MPVLAVCSKFCDIDIQNLFGFNSECQSYTGVSDLPAVILLCSSKNSTFTSQEPMGFSTGPVLALCL